MSLRPDWISPSQTMDMMFTDPLGSMEGFSFGLLRKSMRGTPNSVAGFAFAKLNPRQPSATELATRGLWPCTAADAAVALAPGVADIWSDPALLFTRYETELLPDETGALVVLTLRFTLDHTRHDMFDQAYAFALERLARARRLSTMVVLHVPGESVSRSLPHAHLVAIARTHSASGFGAYDEEVFCDAGQRLLFDEWQSFSRLWNRLKQ